MSLPKIRTARRRALAQIRHLKRACCAGGLFCGCGTGCRCTCSDCRCS